MPIRMEVKLKIAKRTQASLIDKDLVRERNAVYLFLLAAWAACFNSLLAWSRRSFAFLACPCMSHSLAWCAALIFSKAWFVKRWAAARFGCFPLETFWAGCSAMAMPPISSKE